MTQKILRWPDKLLKIWEPHRYKVLRGGRSGMKSHTVAEYLISLAWDKKRRIVCLREVQSSIKDSVKQLLEDKIIDLGLSDDYQVLDKTIRCLKTGSTFVFKGLQSYNSVNIKSLEAFDIAWVEEAQAVSHKSLRILRPTIRKPGSEIIFTYNPRYPTDAIDEFAIKYPPESCLVINTGWQDNPYLSNEVISEIEHDYKVDPAIAAHIWGGGYEVVTEGSYYGHDMSEADIEGRITEVPYEKSSKVKASWDLGIGDTTAIWVFQNINREWHFLRCYQNHSQGLDHYIDWIKKLPYFVDEHVLPHDAQARELQTGKSRVQFLEARGFRCSVVPNHKVEDGIASVRSILNRAWFDADGCQEGIAALRQYRAEINEKNHVLKLRPLHDSNSHYADSFRYAVHGTEEPSQKRKSKQLDRLTGELSWMS